MTSPPLFSKHTQANSVQIQTDHNDLHSSFLQFYYRSAVSHQNVSDKGTYVWQQTIHLHYKKSHLQIKGNSKAYWNLHYSSYIPTSWHSFIQVQAKMLVTAFVIVKYVRHSSSWKSDSHSADSLIIISFYGTHMLFMRYNGIWFVYLSFI